MESDTYIAVTGPAYFYDTNKAANFIAQWLYIRANFLTVGAALGQRPLFGSNCVFRRSAWQQITKHVHRSNNDIHDDIDLSYHLSPIGKFEYDPKLIVGISVRPFKSIEGMKHRYIRGHKSIFLHWPAQAQWRR